MEVATFRSDGAHIDGRHPESVVFSSPELDAQRRDFTINGMFSDPFSGEIIDFVGGRTDLEAQVLRAIGDPWAWFREDKLRLLRAVRFASRFRLTIDPATHAALVTMASQMHVVAAERIAQELRRMLVHETRAQAMDRMLETGLRHPRSAGVALDERSLPRQADAAGGGPLGPRAARARDASPRAEFSARVRRAPARCWQASNDDKPGGANQLPLATNSWVEESRRTCAGAP